MTHVVLLTKAWPYWPGEQFVTPEAERWALSGAEVTVMPLYASPDPRPMPAGWTLDDRLTRLTAGQRRRGLLRALAHPQLTRELATLAPRGLIAPAVARNALTRMREALLVQAAITALHAEHPIDVSYSYWFDTQTHGALLAQVAPVVTRAHRYDLYEDQAPGGYMPFKRWMAPRLAMFAGISHQACDYATDQFGVLSERTHFAPLGVDSAVSATPAGTGDSLQVVSIGTLSKVKQPGLMAEAMMLLAHAHPEWSITWRHAGEGPLRAEVEAALATAPANLHAHLLGQLPPDQLDDVLATGPIDLLVNASTSEGVPVSIMQAMARGIPAVATDVGATHELIVPGAGRLVAATVTAEALSRGIDTFVSHARDEGVRRRCRMVISTRWDSNTNHDEFVAAVLALASL